MALLLSAYKGSRSLSNTTCRGYLFNHIRNEYKRDGEEENTLEYRAHHTTSLYSYTPLYLNLDRGFNKVKKEMSKYVQRCFPNVKINKISIRTNDAKGKNSYKNVRVSMNIDFFDDLLRDVLYTSTISLVLRTALRYITSGSIYSPIIFPFTEQFGNGILDLAYFTERIGLNTVIDKHREMLSSLSIEGHNGLAYTIDKLQKTHGKIMKEKDHFRHLYTMNEKHPDTYYYCFYETIITSIEDEETFEKLFEIYELEKKGYIFTKQNNNQFITFHLYRIRGSNGYLGYGGPKNYNADLEYLLIESLRTGTLIKLTRFGSTFDYQDSGILPD